MLKDNQKIIAETIRNISAVPDVFTHGALKFRNLLNDFIPQVKLERFWLCCVFELPNFVNSLTQGALTKADISRVEMFLHQRLDLSQRTSKWVADTWALAYGVDLLAQRESFNCPHCTLFKECDSQWSNRNVYCPCCNAFLEFSSSLEIKMLKSGWAKKRTKNRKWILTDPDYSQNGSSVREAISKTIFNESLSSYDIAKHIGLDLIVSALHPEISIITGEVHKDYILGQELIVKNILRGMLRKEYVSFDLQDNALLTKTFPEAMELAEGDEWIGSIGTKQKQQFRGLAFTKRNLCHLNNNIQWSIPYSQLYCQSITLGSSITQLILGESRIIDLKGLSIPRRSIQPVLQVIGRCIHEINNSALR